MKCKYCNAELEEGVKVCSVCGKELLEEEQVSPAEETEADLAPATAEPEKETKSSPAKIALSICACVVLLALLVALIVGGMKPVEDTSETTEPTGTTESTEEVYQGTVPADGNPDDVTCKGTYTAADEDVLAAADTVIATIGDKTLTIGQLQVYYGLMVNQFLSSEDFYYLYYYELFDYTQGLDTQICYYDTTMTWQQYFLNEALNAWHCYQSLAIEAELAGYEMEAEYREYLDNLPATMEEDALVGGFANAQEMVEYNLGHCATVDAYIGFQETYYLGYSYYLHQCDQIQPTPEDIEAYFAEHETEYAELGLTKDYKEVDVRHILIMPEGATSETITSETFSDEAWAWAENEAQTILDGWLAGDATEESFAALANERSMDGTDTDGDGVGDTGGLYTGVYEGQMVAEFEDWCFDPVRVVGDYGIVKTVYGYHIMYFVGENYMWDDYVETDMITEQSNLLIENAMEKYPQTVEYGSILLGHIDLA